MDTKREPLYRLALQPRGDPLCNLYDLSDLDGFFAWWESTSWYKFKITDLALSKTGQLSLEARKKRAKKVF